MRWVWLVGLMACEAEEGTDLPFDLPPGLPAPAIPADNPISEAKIALGRALFYDRRLSGNGTQSCADCHHQERAFSDGLALPTGSTGDVVPRNSQTLANVAWWSTYTWMNPVLLTLEEQALVPMFADHPVELGMSAKLPEIVARFEADGALMTKFVAAFPEEASPVTTKNIVAAITSFERTIISAGSPYDRYIYGDDASDFSDEAREGLQLFFSEVTECYHCHAGPLFSTAFKSAYQPSSEPSFINTGVYNLGGTGDYPAPNVGLVEFTGNPVDKGRIRVPTLRNLGYTAPYFHDGSAATLDEVLAHYEAGGRTITEGENAGVGKDNPYKHPLVRPFTLTEGERAALLAFLDSLNDPDFVTDPRFGPP